MAAPTRNINNSTSKLTNGQKTAPTDSMLENTSANVDCTLSGDIRLSPIC
jgi:hypothetical protein